MRLSVLIFQSIIGVFLTIASQAGKPIEPKDVLAQEEIDDIMQKRNFFLRDHLITDGPIWNHLDRKYGHHYLKPRTEFYSFKDVLHRTLADGFPVHYKLQELYRSGLNRHIALGQILPRINITVGESPIVVNVNNLALNLFGFLLPQNWFRLIQANQANKATEYLFLKTILDQYYAAELNFLDLHQLIQDFEIRNFYFIHLQLLNEYLKLSEEDTLTFAGTYATLGTDMATNRGNIKLKFEDLAEVMALRVDREGRYAADHLNIENVADFPERVKDLEEMSKFYKNEEDFIVEVLDKSVELKSIKLFYDIAKLGVGVTAFGSIFNGVDSPNNNYLNLGIAVGYDTLPRILSSISSATTAKIDVESQFVQMVVTARRAFDMSTNAMGGYTEAKRAMELNRQAFAKHLEQVINGHSAADAMFLRDYSNLVQSELMLNNALHGTLKAHALMRRLLVVEEKDLLKYLPDSTELRKIQRLFMAEYPEYSTEGSHLDAVISKLKKPQDLQRFLQGKFTNLDGVADQIEGDTLNTVVTDHMPMLLHRTKVFHDKHKDFYLTLNDFVEENKLHLSLDESRTLRKRAGLQVDEIEFGKKRDKSLLPTMGCGPRKDGY